MSTSSFHEDWTKQALCTGLTKLFTSEDSRDRAHAKRICHECPVLITCREAGEHEVGVWGGTDEAERRAARRLRVRLG